MKKKKKNSSHRVLEPNIRGIYEYKVTNEICLFSSLGRVTGTMKEKKKKKKEREDALLIVIHGHLGSMVCL